MTLENKILNRIKQEQLRPTPKSYFFARDLVIWVLLGIFFLALSLGFAMTMFMIHGTDYGLFEKLGLSSSQKIIYSIPFFWIAASIVVALAVFLNYRNTRRGYKMSTKQLVVIAILVAIALGSILYALDIARFVDKTASERFPIYNSVMPLNTTRWLDPGHGLLSGAVRERESEEDFMLRDANGELWHVTGNDIKIPEDLVWASGDWIKLIGIQIGPGEFRAVEILPWEERGEKVKTEDGTSEII